MSTDHSPNDSPDDATDQAPVGTAIPLDADPADGAEDGMDPDAAPETVDAEHADAPAQAQTFAEAALVRDTAVDGLSDSDKVATGEDSDDVQDLVDHMNQMERSGVIDMDAYRGERNDDDEEDSLGPDGARP